MRLLCICMCFDSPTLTRSAVSVVGFSSVTLFDVARKTDETKTTAGNGQNKKACLPVLQTVYSTVLHNLPVDWDMFG